MNADGQPVRIAPVGGAARRSPLAGRRWLFQHGPMHCVIGADGDAAAIQCALDAAWARFQTVLAELVAELPRLRADLCAPGRDTGPPQGVVARRMVEACRRFAAQGLFITPMAAVAGSVAQELIVHFERPRIRRAYVNNGGDIALHLQRGESFDVGLVIDPARAADASGAGLDGQFRVAGDTGVRGIATSGWRGRSFSLGIADSVTVLAASAALADAAATLIANAVNLEDPRIVRASANALRDDTDLGARLVTVGVPQLEPQDVARALDAGAAFARAQLDAGVIHAAVLCLQGQHRCCGEPGRGAPTHAGPILRPAAPAPPRLPPQPRPALTGA
jgi:uncharacterized protein